MTAPALVSEDAFRWPEQPLAKGGMAVVYEGEDRRLTRKVILKAPREDVELPKGMENMLSDRLVAESRVLARLQHPSIVTIYEMGQATTGTPFCVLEKVEGRALRDVLEDLEREEADGEIRTRERLELLQGLVSIAEAIAYAHERGIVHRDVTPNNILIGARGEPTLIDWGLAKDIGAMPDPSESRPQLQVEDETISAGTPPYLPREQAKGMPADPSYDVYSFGMTLYEVVSGRTAVPWSRVNSTEAREQRMDIFMRWLDEGGAVKPAAPDDPELSGIIARAIERDAVDRFTADELLRALKQYLTGELVFSHRYSLTGRFARWVRKHRGVFWSLSALVLAMVAVAVVTLALLTTRAQGARDRAALEAEGARQAQRAAELEVATQAEARKSAELGSMAAAAKLDAAAKAEAAARAADKAKDAEKRADAAKKRGENSDQLRAEADEQRKLAEAARHDAEDAAKRAEGDASDAENRWTAAMAERDDAVKARTTAEKRAAEAESARATADQARAGAEAERAQEAAARAAAEEAHATATRDKLAADEARARAESDLAAAKRRIDALEAKLADCDKGGGSDKPPAAPDAGP